MNRLARLIAAAAIMVGCDDPTTSDTPTRPIETPPTFAVVGSIRDEASAPISGAVAEVTTGVYRGLLRMSNDSGKFSLVGVRGPMNVRIWKEGYGPQLHSLHVSNDMSMEVTLAKTADSDTIVFGKTIRTSIFNGYLPCDRNWDAQAPCRPFIVRPSVSGWLSITISWAGEPELDAAIVSSRGVYLAYSTAPVNESVTLVMYVSGGATYELRVHSYYGSQVFNLKAELTPFPAFELATSK